MKYILEFLLGMILIFSMIGFVNAQYDWKTYGKDIDSMTNAQDIFGVGRLDLNIQSVSSVYGSTYLNNNSNFQAIVTGLGNPLKQFIIVPNGNNLQVIDSNMNLISSVPLGNPANSQISSFDFDNDGNVNDIIVLTNSSSTNFVLRVFSFDSANSSFISIPLYSYNFTLSAGSTFTGFRCINGNCYGAFSKPQGVNFNFTFVRLNQTTLIYSNLTLGIPSTSYTALIQPPSLNDYNNDGKIEYMIYSPNKILIFDDSMTLLSEIYNGNIGSGDYLAGVISSVKMIQPDFSNIWKIAVFKRYDSGISGCFDASAMFLLNQSGSMYWVYGVDCATSSSDNVYPADISIADFNGDGFDDIFAGSFRGVSNVANPFYVFAGNGTALASYNLPLIADYNPVNSLTIAKLNGDSYYDLIITINNKVSILDIKHQSVIYNSTGNPLYSGCVPADINLDGFQEVVCSGAGVSKYFYSGAGLICNNNTICESQYNENIYNCPTDCSSQQNQTTNQTIPDVQQSDNGGMPIPSKIVDVNDFEKGLLPEIYYGTLGFLSNALYPAMIVIFVIFVVLIMLAFGFIIKRIAQKVGELGR